MNILHNILPTNGKNLKEEKLSLTKRRLYQALFIMLFAVVLLSATTIPFLYQSQTLWYKVGIDSLMLYLGQLCGMVALILLFFQVVLATRSNLLTQLFGPSSLMKLHRINGVAVVVAAVCHVLLVLVPEGIANLPIGLKYWPELVGAVLFFLLASLVFFAYFRDRLKLNYKKWRASHKPLGYLALVLVLVHVLFVSDTFENIGPRIFIIVLFSGVFLLVVWVKFFSKSLQ